MSDDWPQGWYQGENAGQVPSGAGRGVPSWTPSAQGGPAQGGPAQGGWPQQPPAAPPRGTPGQDPAWRSPQSGGGRRWRFWGQPGHRVKRVLTYFVTLVVVIVLALAGTYFWVNSKLNRSVTLPATTNVSAGTNWLIAGSDGRDGLTTQQIIADHVGFDFGTDNSDSLMLLHMGSGRPVLVSIPRDSYVDIPGSGYNKINAALGFGGPALLIKTVEDVTGLKINHYMGIGFGGLVSVVDQVGGVRICLPAPLTDSDSGVNLKAGCQNLSGTQALAFVRDRHSFATEDLQREQDQRAFLKALMDKAMSPSVYLNPFVSLPFASTSASSISVDKGTSLYDLIQAALALRNPETTTVPIANANYYTSNAGDAVQWNQGQASELFNDLAKDNPVPSSLISGTTIG
jgi:LCP family protein required for cell wall assembly